MDEERERKIEAEVRQGLPPPRDEGAETLEKMAVRQAQLRALRRMMEIEVDLAKGQRT